MKIIVKEVELMKFNDKISELPSEQEVQLYFYDYHHHQIEGTSVTNLLISPCNWDFEGLYRQGAGAEYAYPINITDPFDEDLALYSVGGVGTFNIFCNEGKQDYPKFIRDCRKLLYNTKIYV